jgi:DNA-directed RNA polymerase subunit RPC12/RpoP
MSFKINYKGANTGINYTYKCSCGEIREVRHSASKTPEVRCKVCQGLMSRVLLSAPCLDADLHDRGLFHNIGGDFE